MKKTNLIFKAAPFLFLFSIPLVAFSQSCTEYTRATGGGQYLATEQDTVINQRQEKEKKGIYSIIPYKPSYFLPLYYTTKPAKNVYLNHTPNNEHLLPFDAKLQFSFKVPVWQDIFNRDSDLYLAYTQISYWQAYNKSAFFRETNYEPEIFLANNIDGAFLPGWKFNLLNLGLSHQSNGRGGELERAWERVYLEGIFSNKNWMVSLKPWYPIRQATAHHYNPDITRYLGYGHVLVGYKYNDQAVTLEVRNAAESHFKRGALQVDWRFPLTKHLGGYVQLFSGYGQSLIEYNHYTNSVGIGISLNHWL